MLAYVRTSEILRIRFADETWQWVIVGQVADCAAYELFREQQPEAAQKSDCISMHFYAFLHPRDLGDSKFHHFQ